MERMNHGIERILAVVEPDGIHAIGDYVERMQILQITRAVGDRIRFDGTGDEAHIIFSGYDASSSPVRLGMDGDNKTIQVATHLIRPDVFATRNSPVPIGANGTSAAVPDMANRDAFRNLASLYVGADWCWAQSGVSGATSAATSALRSYMIKSLVTNGASGVATVATADVSTVVSMANSYIAYQSRVRTAMQAIEEYDLYFLLGRLGAEISYTNINGQIVLHGISYNNSVARQRAARFICTEGLRRYLTSDWLREIVLMGGTENSGSTYARYIDFTDDSGWNNPCCDDCG